MAIFNSDNKTPATSTETTIIAGGANIEGVFNCNSRLHVDGNVNGQINSNNIVTIGKAGNVEGDVIADKLVVSGLFKGNADCNGVEVLQGGMILGSILSSELLIEAGAKFEGQSKIKETNSLDNLKKINNKKPTTQKEKDGTQDSAK